MKTSGKNALPFALGALLLPAVMLLCVGVGSV